MSIFRCPLCTSSMQLVGGKHLQCSNGHSFDLARHGYVNFLPAPFKSTYDNRLFVARSAVCDSGFYDVLHAHISELLTGSSFIASGTGSTLMLDAGCGEGSHLARVLATLKEQHGAEIAGVGLDLSKEGIVRASRRFPELHWCVADLANSPFHDGQFAAILNILSPANYSEFARLLAHDGLLIKVIPESGYLQELRAHFFAQTKRSTYSNERVVNRFCSRFTLLEKQRLQYTMALEGGLIESLVQMTPLAWRAADTDVLRTTALQKLEITIDVSVLVGKATATI
ncbi:UNVERIFIED_CONTAM: 23S rRNA (guanine745-N1)-methyltransferase [Brevibacillus sp. OAP136]